MAIYQQPLKEAYSIYQTCMAQYQILQLMPRGEYYIHFIDKEPYFSTLSISLLLPLFFLLLFLCYSASPN